MIQFSPFFWGENLDILFKFVSDRHWFIFFS